MRFPAKKQLLHSIYLDVGRGTEFNVLFPMVGIEVQFSFGEGTNKLVIQDLDLVSGFRIDVAIFLQWGNTRDVTLHILDVGKELLVVRTWIYNVADVVIMGSSTCLLGFFLDLHVAMPVRSFLVST